MTKKTGITAAILTLALAGVLVWAIMTMSELKLTKEELSSTIAHLEIKKIELEDTKGELESTREALEDTRDELESTANELSDTLDELDSTESELESTSSMLSSTRSELSRTETELAATSSELENKVKQMKIARDTLAGLGITLSTSVDCHDVDLVDNPESTNPTWAQLKSFLTKDLTDLNEYVLYEYDCSEFSQDVHNNAEAAGIRSAVVHIDFSNNKMGHALNAFLTDDYGLVYVDCTGGPDTVARIESMKSYRSVQVNLVSIVNVRNDWWWNSLYSYYYITSTSGNPAVTDKIIIYW